MTKLIKFGGSSLANGEQYQKVINIIKSDENRQIIVLSAPGKRFSDDIKVTDLLIDYATKVINKNDYQDILKNIIQRYQDIADTYDISDKEFAPIVNIFKQLPDKDYLNNDYLMAAFKAHGERMNAKLMAIILNHLNISAKFVDPKELGIVVSDENPNAADVLDETYENLGHFGYGYEKLVIPGFFGYTKNDDIATFARGGSDITGSIIANGLNIPMYENFTDVSSIYSANPKIINHPVSIKKMTYREMRELAYAGFSVFNDEAIIPAIKGNVTINVKNTNLPDEPGTLIVPEGSFQPEHPITGVSSSNRFSALYLHKYLLNKEVGITLKLLTIFQKYNISYEHMPSGIDDLTIIFDKDNLDKPTIKKLCNDIQETIKPDKLSWIDDYAIIMVVGEGMRDSANTISDIIEPITNDNIPIHMINQGASQISIMIGTREANANQAVKSIYKEFFNKEK
ncbi:aspartate kinase [Apilactobacillus apisilvae]|uniref:Aspartokinase n=1 Tax=Apilactobacillus apisilvae TaxID=2923364 RepID=A0ABY4PFQ0_9LACO|nr:aspartate kinase [Apilactobacillus apisilvae]UQS84437.1 aspartate kinase [Apilactobacillus apisilvae]